MADEITLVADRYYPYNGIPNSPQPGYMIELAEYAMAQAGHTVKYQLMPWRDAIEQVTRGEKNCVVATYKNDAPELLFPEIHQGVDRLGLYASAGKSWQYNGVASLAGQRLAVIDGYSYTPEIDKYIEQHKGSANIINRRGMFALEYNLQDLLKGKVDVLIDSSAVVQAALQKLKLEEQIKTIGFLTPPSKNYIACSPALASSTEYISLIVTATRQLRANGELAAILAKYGLKDWLHIPAIDE
ncbi:transporter substrate-binding domain-containing protein [Dasania sp. GY-MA-18]|uniref:Transporter substrate-binding domain-containing protein n=1 Tax=Dasania phycosphaerae TaxID=2950436 RepID=A0A9J6RLZ9_9GAMM|nr:MULTISPECIES: transporter substrate-binding domain-containing protein [Dasania]MCR8922785.1 transporter substrate-binding domain-containing protein [Dasania sp. GY-MA-18]MCZ0865215.1 transporter substrate-binding domain-containing protein [Dasania phycosphaerae]MCZ0868941.1 transporter substrate-binding domain-containing protein [Dasania phycosphaerae]